VVSKVPVSETFIKQTIEHADGECVWIPIDFGNWSAGKTMANDFHEMRHILDRQLAKNNDK
jgi:hypothetical protein